MIVGRLYQSVKQSFEALTALKDMLRHPETTLILSAAKAEVLRAGKSPGIKHGGVFQAITPKISSCTLQANKLGFFENRRSAI